MLLESQKPRASLIPAGYSVRLMAMVGALVLIGATIYNLRDRARGEKAPGTVVGAPARKAAPQKNAQTQSDWKETIVPGPADDDPVEMEQARKLFEGVFDAHDMVESDMPAYWKLMKWARSRSFSELEQRANRNVPFAKLFREPEKHRGELIRLRLHVRRIYDWDAPKNSAGVKTVYDISGVTDESISNVYTVICSELPPEIPVETNAYSEAVFVGYFLKLLAYTGADNNQRGAPLLIGRIKAVTGAKTVAEAQSEGLLAMVAIGVAILLAALMVATLWRIVRKKHRPAPTCSVPSLPTADVEAWLQNPGQAEAQPQATHSGNGSVHPQE